MLVEDHALVRNAIRQAITQPDIEVVAESATAEAALEPALSVRTDGRVPMSSSDLPRLTERETEVLRMISDGLTDRETAVALSISIRTVETHVSNVLHKLGVRSRSEAAQLYREHGKPKPGLSA